MTRVAQAGANLHSSEKRWLHQGTKESQSSLRVKNCKLTLQDIKTQFHRQQSNSERSVGFNLSVHTPLSHPDYATMADWATDAPSPAVNASMAAAAGSVGGDEISDRTSVITGRLKTIYRKTVLPVEKKYQYDYFYESPLLTDVEFDGRLPFQQFFFLVRRRPGSRSSGTSTKEVPSPIATNCAVNSCAVFLFRYHFYQSCSQATGSIDRTVQCWKDFFYSLPSGSGFPWSTNWT